MEVTSSLVFTTTKGFFSMDFCFRWLKRSLRRLILVFCLFVYFNRGDLVVCVCYWFKKLTLIVLCVCPLVDSKLHPQVTWLKLLGIGYMIGNLIHSQIRLTAITNFPRPCHWLLYFSRAFSDVFRASTA